MTFDLLFGMKTLFAVATMIATFASTSSAAAILAESFENTAVGTSLPLSGATVVDTGNGITEGTQAAFLSVPGGNSFQVGPRFDINNIPGPITAIEVDVTAENVNLNDGFLQFVLGTSIGDPNVSFAEGSTYVQVDGTKEMDPLTGNSFIGGGVGPQAFTFQYTDAQDATAFQQINAAIAGGTPVGAAIVLNKANSVIGDFTFDNIRVTNTATAVPEPSTMLGLGCVAGLTALRRRRRR